MIPAPTMTPCLLSGMKLVGVLSLRRALMARGAYRRLGNIRRQNCHPTHALLFEFSLNSGR
jgi:hypothetical protein